MWHVIYYKTDKGQSLVQDFIDSRNKKRHQAKVLTQIEALEERGPTLPRPYADLLDDGIHELGIRLSGEQIRILYFFCFKDFVILTNAFAKTTSHIPRSAIEETERYRKDFLDRVTEKDLREIVR
jgi:hypothetical protein